MKVYFAFSITPDRSNLPAARRIVATLESLGHKVLTRYLIDDDAREKDRALGPKTVHERAMRWLSECDLFVAETSASTFGVGFEAGYLIGAATAKVVLFYDRKLESNLSFMITGNTLVGCTLVPYGKVDELASLVRLHVVTKSEIAP